MKSINQKKLNLNNIKKKNSALLFVSLDAIESNYNLINVIKKVLLNKVTIIDDSGLNKSKILKTPKIRIVLKYLFYKIKLLNNMFLKKHILRKKQTWTVCYSRNSFD